MVSKENIVQMIVLGSSLAVVLLVGQMVIVNMNDEYVWASGFCADKETGTYNITKYMENSTINIRDNELKCILGKPYLEVDATM